MCQRVPGAESTLEHEVSEKMEDVRSSFRHKMVEGGHKEEGMMLDCKLFESGLFYKHVNCFQGRYT